ncbi:glycosyl hydrolase family 16 [Coprinopsis cinerea AmutBmut pab1-1]|nr:glycosyl hydrolase family 16 [Coprinopsis cinerea AmutBmut pab1-1]
MFRSNLEDPQSSATHISTKTQAAVSQNGAELSYGPYFDEQGGGVFAMKWDENGIAVCPSTELPFQRTSRRYFRNYTVILNITFCGDWAGNSYATSGCPGTCPDRLMDPANFVNATWSINSMKVYRKQPIYAEVVDPNKSAASRNVLGSSRLGPSRWRCSHELKRT